MKSLLALGLLVAGFSSYSSPALAGPTSTTVFDAGRAWTSFEDLLRGSYGYFDRPGVDGSAILASFAVEAKSARSDAEFIDVLQKISHNFADPHFVVGPFDGKDWSVIPTSSDLYASGENGRYLIREVRYGSDAAGAGIRPGMTVVTINGLSPAAAIEAVTVRPLRSLSQKQADFAINVALAGKPRQQRTIVLRDGRRSLRFELAPSSEFARKVREGPLLTVEQHGSFGVIRINNSLGNQELIAAFSKALASLSGTSRLLIDLRNTPSGGNTSVARGIMGHFVDTDRPYQIHVIPYESRVLGPPRRFMEFVLPFGFRYPGKVYVAGGRWTGSMGEGLMVGFDALGATTVGSELAHLLGGLSNERIDGSEARIDLGTEQLFTTRGLPREDFRPVLFVTPSERTDTGDPVITAIDKDGLPGTRQEDEADSQPVSALPRRAYGR